MDLFDDFITEIKVFQGQKRISGEERELPFSEDIHWPEGGNRNLVLESETGLEIGNPSDESVSLTLWTEARDLVVNNRISLIGPDVPENKQGRLPFGKIVLIGVHGFNDDNAYDRYREIDLVRFDVSLKGYMMRAASQYMREWSRISRDAIDKGFSFSILGSSLITAFRKLEYVEAAEVIFITSKKIDFTGLKHLASKVSKINGAMSKIMEGISHDCEACDYEEACREVAAIRGMRKVKEAKRARLDA